MSRLGWGGGGGGGVEVAFRLNHCGFEALRQVGAPRDFVTCGGPLNLHVKPVRARIGGICALFAKV